MMGGVKVGSKCSFCFARFTYRTGGLGLEHQHPLSVLLRLIRHVHLTWSLAVFIFQAPRVELQKITYLFFSKLALLNRVLIFVFINSMLRYK